MRQYRNPLLPNLGSIFLHSFTFADRSIAALPNLYGIISYAVPPPEVMEVFKATGTPHPPLVAITMCKPKERTIAYAHIDPEVSCVSIRKTSSVVKPVLRG